MSYDDILKTSLRITKEKSQPVFSDIIGATTEVGRLAEFIKETEIIGEFSILEFHLKCFRHSTN